MFREQALFMSKDTTGLMVVARNIPAQTQLVDMMQKREITREYEAVCNGVMTAGGMVDEPIGRHPTKRTHMAVVGSLSPPSHYRVMERFRAHALLRLRLESGRTHQIRVHVAYSSSFSGIYLRRAPTPTQASE